MAEKHYWQVTDADFERAVRGEGDQQRAAIRAAISADQELSQKRTQQRNPLRRNENAGYAETCATRLLGGQGFGGTNLSADTSGGNPPDKGAVSLDLSLTPLLADNPALADLIEALADLPEDKRRAILDALRGRRKR